MECLGLPCGLQACSDKLIRVYTNFQRQTGRSSIFISWHHMHVKLVTIVLQWQCSSLSLLVVLLILSVSTYWHIAKLYMLWDLKTTVQFSKKLFFLLSCFCIFIKALKLSPSRCFVTCRSHLLIFKLSNSYLQFNLSLKLVYSLFLFIAYSPSCTVFKFCSIFNFFLFSFYFFAIFSKDGNKGKTVNFHMSLPCISVRSSCLLALLLKHAW